MAAVSKSDYTEVNERIGEVLRTAFGPNTAVEMEPGEYGRGLVKIVSSRFNGVPAKEKQDIVWDVLRRELGAKSQAIALALVLGMDEV